MNSALRAARIAGSTLKEDYLLSKGYMAKSAHDVVTETDLKAEEQIIDILSGQFPDHNIRSEEIGDLDIKSDYCWYIDPLDGTSNFATGNPYFSVSIGLAYQQEMVLGIVYNPISDELFHAQKGHGSFLNKQTIRISERNVLSDALIALAFAAEENKINEGLRQLNDLVFRCRKVQLNFAPALDLCNMARGRLDALIDNGSTAEDHAAASLILQEAGGLVRNYHQADWMVSKTGIIACTPHLQDEFFEILFTHI